MRLERTTKEWKEFRKMILQKYPACVICGDIATVVHHHSDTYMDYWEYFDPNNVVTMCRKCHYDCHKEALEEQRLINEKMDRLYPDE